MNRRAVACATTVLLLVALTTAASHRPTDVEALRTDGRASTDGSTRSLPTPLADVDQHQSGASSSVAPGESDRVQGDILTARGRSSTPRSAAGGQPPSSAQRATATPTPTSSAPVSQVLDPGGLRAPLRTSGNRMLDATGSPVVLRGVNRIGLQDPGGSPPITDAEIGHAKDWGVNIMRLLVGDAWSDPQCPNHYMANYFDDVDAVVHSLTSRGMVALLDLHAVTRVACGESDQWRMADAPGAIKFWTTVAARYKDNPLVAFDLYNEPFDITADQWRNGGVLVDQSFGKPTVQWTGAGMQQMYDAIRSTGADNLVMITGNNWGGDPTPILQGYAVSGTNIVYAAHSYTCSHNNQPVCTATPGNKRASVASGWPTVAQRYPVMITEFGWPEPNDGAYNASVIQYAQSQNPPWGWIAFAWDGTQNNGFVLVGNLATYEPDASGAPVKAALQAPP